MFRKLLTKVFPLAPMFFFFNIAPVQAQTGYTLYAIPTDWRLENYPGHAVALWYTGSVCKSGNLNLPANATEGDKNRLFSTIMLAKATSRHVGIFYTVIDGNCVISSFYLQGK